MMSDTPAFMTWDLPGELDPWRYPFREWQAGRCGICGIACDTPTLCRCFDKYVQRNVLCPA